MSDRSIYDATPLLAGYGACFHCGGLGGARHGGAICMCPYCELGQAHIRAAELNQVKMP